MIFKNIRTSIYCPKSIGRRQFVTCEKPKNENEAEITQKLYLIKLSRGEKAHSASRVPENSFLRVILHSAVKSQVKSFEEVNR